LEQEQALRDEALKRQAAAQRAQIAIDTVTQATSLVTASANIFSALSPIPFVGIPLAIAAIATLFASFAAAKAQAFQATRASFDEGGRITTGYSDENGGRGNRVEGTNIVVGRGEWVVNRKASERHNDFLHNLNRGDYDGLDLESAILGSQRGSKLVIASNKAKYKYERQKRFQRSEVLRGAINRQTRQLSKKLDALYEKEEIAIDSKDRIVTMKNHVNGSKTTKRKQLNG